jgi:cytochrome c oxidase assembly protein subunit 15
MTSSKPPWAATRALHRYVLALAGATLALLFAGGLVTSTGSGLAVPDWPLAFGRLIPDFEHVGIVYEYSHRVIAGVVLLLTVGLVAASLRVERRGWLRKLSVLALCLVLFQALLGGVTVLLELPTAVSVTHAATAQAFFALLVAIAVFTSQAWEQARRRREDATAVPLALLAAVTTVVIYAQTILGAVMRHMGAGLVIPDFPLSFGGLIPPYFDEYVAVNFAHRCGAIVVAAMVIWTAARVLRGHIDQPWLRRPAAGLLVLLAVQITLGALTVWTGKAVIPTTAHLAVGAALLATSLTLALRAFRIYGLRRLGREHDERADRDMIEQRIVA